MVQRRNEPSALGDIRVLDLSGEMGMYCGKLLADLGADVIKIEPPGGDPARRVGPFYHDEPDVEKSLAFFYLNTSKRGITLNLQLSDSRELFRRLVSTADVVVESFPPGYLDGLGLGYQGLCQIRPDIILTSVTGFGQWGPHAHYKAPDIVGVAMSGVLWLAGYVDDPPNLPYGNQGYLSASIQAAAGTLMALYHRDVTGEGQQVDVSMQEALSIAQETAMQTWDMNRAVRCREGASRLGLIVPGIGPYQCKDGWVFSYIGTPGGATWSELLAWMIEEGAAEDLVEEPHRSLAENINMRFITGLMLDLSSAVEKLLNLQHVDEVLRRFFAARNKWYVYEEGQRRRLLIGIVSTPKDLAENRQLAFREFFQGVHHPELNDTLRYPGPPVRMAETPWRMRRRPPLVGEHNEEIYCGELGLQPEEVALLYARGAI
jgi:crotonobetainyl-CoA:carnitine CoA-transferase CaiB-like acyl-CoA transferase